MLFGRPSPKDTHRYPAGYAAGLTPTIMGQIFDAADAGEIGPLCELSDEIRGKDQLVKGLSGDRLSTVADSNLWIEPNPADPSAARQGELVMFLEQLFAELKLYRYEDHDGDRVPIEAGEFPDVCEVFALPWYHGLGIYFPVWATKAGEPRPTIAGVEYIDPRRYRTHKPGSQTSDETLYIESVNDMMGEPLWKMSPLLWFPLYANQAGLPTALAGAGRALIFPFWLNVGGLFTASRLLEKYGVPNVIGVASYPEGPQTAAFTPEQRADLEAFLAAYQSDTTALFPKGFEAKILNVSQGSHELARFVDEQSTRRIRLTITGNEVTGVAAAPGQAGVAGGSGTIGERIQARLNAQDKRRTVQGLRHLARRAITIWYGPSAPVPIIKLLDPSVAAPAAGTNTAPTKTTQGTP